MAERPTIERVIGPLRRVWENKAAVALIVFAISTLALATGGPKGSERDADIFGYLLVAVVGAAVYFRRTSPLPATAVATLATITYWVADYGGAVELGLMLLLYHATRHGGADRRRVWTVVSASIATTTVVSIIGVLAPTEDLPPAAIIGILALHTTFAAIGEAIYQRAQHIAELEARNRALEEDLETKARLAVVDERNRIAREMHDIIAHGMSSMVVQAAAAQRVVDTDVDATKRALGAIENIGRESVHEMRRMLGVLRDIESERELEPQPSIDDFRQLGHRAIDAGVDTTMGVYGEQRPAPPGIELTAYRVIQEALTNIVRHAGRPVSAEVSITYLANGIEIEVVDDGLGSAARNDTAGSGLGLVGMRERVQIYDGELEAGPKPTGGYRVRAYLPTAAARTGVSS